jgi:hypothetical protein
MKENEDMLAFLLGLNLELADREEKRQPITPPGLPNTVQNSRDFSSDDCIQLHA